MKKEEALKMYHSEFWKDLTHKQRASFQLFEERLCMPFDVFHEAVQKTLKRPVYTHEFGFNAEGLQKELMRTGTPPTLKEIIEMLPAAKKKIILTINP